MTIAKHRLSCSQQTFKRQQKVSIFEHFWNSSLQHSLMENVTYSCCHHPKVLHKYINPMVQTDAAFVQIHNHFSWFNCSWSIYCSKVIFPTARLSTEVLARKMILNSHQILSICVHVCIHLQPHYSCLSYWQPVRLLHSYRTHITRKSGTIAL